MYLRLSDYQTCCYFFTNPIINVRYKFWKIKSKKKLEAFEKRSILLKVKEGENLYHPREIGFTFYGAGTNTLSILRINPLKFNGGLKF